MSRNAPNLYELLKEAGAQRASAPSTTEGSAATAAPEPVAATQTPVKMDPTPPASEAAPRPPALTPLRPPAIAPPSGAVGLGERVLRVTYNGAAFAGLVVLGVVFLAYAIGVRVGRASAASAATASITPRTGDLAPAIQEPAPVYTIRLKEWPGATAQQRSEGQANASKMKATLDSRQLAASEIRVVGDKVVLNYGKFTDTNSADAKRILATLRDVRRTPKDDPLFKGAGFVRAD